jgi:ribosomal protein S12 methylthiotransferase accessory factor
MQGSDFSAVCDLFDVVFLSAPSDPVQLTVALPKAPAELPLAARPASGRIASGRGLTREQALASCLGEAAELVSACYWGDEPLIRASYAEVKDKALHPAELLLVSEAQYQERDRWNARYGAFDWLPYRFDETEPIDWIEATSPDGSDRVLIPAAYAYIGYFEAGDDRAFAVGDSNGCAAGATFEEAAVAAFLELVERDATAIWWYGGHKRPAIDVAGIEGANELFAWLAYRERKCHVLDLTTDLGIPVCAAISADGNGRAVALGTAAHFDASRAVVAALTEMVQIEFSLNMRKALPAEGTDAFQFWLDTVSLSTIPNLVPLFDSSVLIRAPLASPAATIESCAGICRNASLRLLLIDVMRPSVSLPAVRLIMPGLRPTRCRQAKGRLFDVPRELGLSPAAARPRRIPLSV